VLHHEQQSHEPLSASDELPRLKFIAPLLPMLSEEPPEGEGWLHEIKHDGYRTQVHVEPAGVRTYTRNAYEWTDRYWVIAEQARALTCRSAILDGEVIVQDAQGRSDFHSLRAAIQNRPRELVFMAFDLLHLDGEDLRKKPLGERRARLQKLIGPPDPGSRIHFSEELAGDAQAFFKAADDMGLEGIVSKRVGSRYRSGPSTDWLKTKCFMEEELVVIGTEHGDRAPVALLAREHDGVLEYAGGAMVTLRQAERDLFWQTAERLKADRPALAMKPRKGASWLKPLMRVRVKTLRGEEMLRHATVKAVTAT
jgi:DNA ligase D-like protein (predicted ligase)